MNGVIDDFLLKAMTKRFSQPKEIRVSHRAEKEVDLPVFVPVMTLERFSDLSGIPPGVLRGNCDCGHIPTRIVGRRRVVNVSLLNQLLLEGADSEKGACDG